MAAKLVEHLRSSGLPCEGINCFTMTEEMGRSYTYLVPSESTKQA